MSCGLNGISEKAGCWEQPDALLYLSRSKGVSDGYRNRPQGVSNSQVLPQVKDQPLLIGGKWLDSVSGKTFGTLNPATGEVICQVAEGDKADIDLAVKAAARRSKKAHGRR